MEDDLALRNEYLAVLLMAILVSIPIVLAMIVYVVVVCRGTALIWETILAHLPPNVDRCLYTVVVGTVAGLVAALVLRFLGRAGGRSLQQELADDGRVAYTGLPGLMLAALVGLVSGCAGYSPHPLYRQQISRFVPPRIR